MAFALMEKTIDAVTFTSSSTVTNFCDLLRTYAPPEALLAHVCVASIGPVTTATAEHLGVRVDVTATEYTFVCLVDALETYFASGLAPGVAVGTPEC